MTVHVHATAAERDPFDFQAETLLQAGRSLESDAPAGGHDPVPR